MMWFRREIAEKPLPVFEKDIPRTIFGGVKYPETNERREIIKTAEIVTGRLVSYNGFGRSRRKYGIKIQWARHREMNPTGKRPSEDQESCGKT